MYIHRRTFFLWIFCLYAPVGWGKAVIKAKQDHVKIYEKASKTAAITGELQKGGTLPAHNRTGMFWEVESTSGKMGYVSVLSVQYEADGKSNEGISSALHNAIQKTREEDESAQVRARTSVMGVRGLDESKDSEFAGNVRPNLRMVYEMEDRVVAPAKLNKLAQDVTTEVEHRVEAESKGVSHAHP